MAKSRATEQPPKRKRRGISRNSKVIAAALLDAPSLEPSKTKKSRPKPQGKSRPSKPVASQRPQQRAEPPTTAPEAATAQSGGLILVGGDYWDVADDFSLGAPLSVEPDLAPPALSVEDLPVTTFDPFDIPAAPNHGDLAEGEEPPFDPPTVEDLYAEPAREREHAEDVEADLPPTPIARPEASSAGAPAASAHKNEYLRKARRAAQEQAVAPPEPRLFGFRVEEIKRLAVGITAGLAAPVLFGVWTFSGHDNEPQQQDAPGLLGPAVAEAAPARPPAIPDYATAYRTALERLSSGRERDGVALLRDAAEGGFVLAQYRLAKLYEHGESVPQNLALARAWAERAAHGGSCRAMHDVGVYYARGDGAQVDEAAAFRWFRQAAEFGVADSQYNLGLLYQQGRGVSASGEEALFWFLVAAHQRDVNAVDRAIDLATQLSPPIVDRAQARARAFQARAADPAANEGACATA